MEESNRRSANAISGVEELPNSTVAIASRVRQVEYQQASEKFRNRATAFLSNDRQVTVAGTDLTLLSFIDALDETIAKARKARTKSITLDTFLRILKDQAKGNEHGK